MQPLYGPHLGNMLGLGPYVIGPRPAFKTSTFPIELEHFLPTPHRSHEPDSNVSGSWAFAGLRPF